MKSHQSNGQLRIWSTVCITSVAEEVGRRRAETGNNNNNNNNNNNKK